MLHTYPLLIIESYIDTLGHVNNATYLEIMEEARWEMITARGYGLDKIKESGMGPVILEVNLKFLNEIRVREKIEIQTSLIDYKGKIGQLLQKIVKENGQIAAEAVFVFGLFDLSKRKLVEPTTAWQVAVGLSQS